MSRPLVMGASVRRLVRASAEQRAAMAKGALRKRLVAYALVERGPMRDTEMAQVVADAGVPLPGGTVHTWPHTLRRDGIIERTDLHPGRPVWRITEAAAAWVAANRAPLIEEHEAC